MYQKVKYRNIDTEKIPVFIDISQQPNPTFMTNDSDYQSNQIL